MNKPFVLIFAESRAKVFINGAEHAFYLYKMLERLHQVSGERMGELLGDTSDYRTVIIKNSKAKKRLNDIRSRQSPRYDKVINEVLAANLTEYVYYS